MKKILVLLVLSFFLMFGCIINQPQLPSDGSNIDDGTNPIIPLPGTEIIVERADLRGIADFWISATNINSLCVSGGGDWHYTSTDVGCYGVGKLDCGTADAVAVSIQCRATGADFVCNPTQLSCSYS